MKHASCGSNNQPAKKSKHKVEYDVRWKEEFPRHIPVHCEEGNSASEVTGLLCSICQCHGTKQRNNAGTWTEKPCAHLREDMLQ